MQLTTEDWLNIEREECKQSLSFFVKRAWKSLEPSQPYIHGWHIDAIAEHLEAVTRGEITRLLINIPPGTMKSMMVGVMWPAWEWGPLGNKSKRIIGASHESTLATRDNLNMRRLISSEWYQKLWPTILTGDQNEKTFFQNTDMGWRQSCAVKSMTGRRADCLTGDAIIVTNYGPIAIKDLVENDIQCNVLSYCDNTKRVVYRPVEAVARSASKEIYRVYFADGSMVQCTGDHRIYTTRGYIQARLLSSDDVCLRVLPSEYQKECVPAQKARKEWTEKSVLWIKLQYQALKSINGKDWPVLQYMWEQVLCKVQAMLRCVQRGSAQKDWSVEKDQKTRDTMRHLRKNIFTAKFGAKESLLQPRMRKCWTQLRSAICKQSKLAWWSRCKTIRSAQCKTVSQGSKASFIQRLLQMREMLSNQQSARASHGYGYIKQYLEKFSNALRWLPCFLAQHKEVKTILQPVALVERISESAVVYDIQVAETRCFFANGILVHNCVIWDDPHSVEDAYSKAALDTANRVFRETLPTRLNNPDSSAIVVVMQRIAEDDISGEILKGEYGYEHLMLPMEYESARQCKTSIGFVDPRTTDGELLFPERFSREVVERDKKIMGAHAVAGQFQQRPSPLGGGLIKGAWFGRYKELPTDRQTTRRAIFADTAMKTGERNDYTVFMDVLQDRSGKLYCLNVFRKKVDAVGLLSLAKDVWASADGKASAMYIEDKASGTGLIQQLQQADVFIPVIPVQRTKDKLTRLMEVQAKIEAGIFLLPEHSHWVAGFIQECESFTADDSHAFDDQIDPLIDSINILAGNHFDLSALL